MAKKAIIKRHPVESSHIVSIGYDAEKRILEVEYKKPGGTVWQYSPVLPDAYLDLEHADSLGKWIHANIKDNPTITAQHIS